MVKYKEKYLEVKAQLDALKTSGTVNLVDTFFDNSDKITDGLILGALTKLSLDLKYPALWGPIGLKLATTPYALPVQIVGLTMLATLAIIPQSDSSPVQDVVQWIDDTKAAVKSEWERNWDSLTSCDDRRGIANYFHYTRGIPDDQVPYMVGWYDSPDGAPGARYAECKGLPPEGTGVR